MASSSLLNSIPLSSSSSSLNVLPHSFPITSSTFLSSPIRPFSCSLRPLFAESKSHSHQKRNNSRFPVKAGTLDFADSFFEDGFGSEDPFSTALEEKEEPQCPPGLRQYETMLVLRPDMSEDERLALTQKYEELLVAGGGMYVEVFNRGVMPLAYCIKKKNKDGESNIYMDSIFLLFTYFTKPESIKPLDEALLADDNVIRSTSFKIRKRKY